MTARPLIAAALSLSLFAFSGPLRADPIDNAKAALLEAEALRASEFAPQHFTAATLKVTEAEKLISSGLEQVKAARLINEAHREASPASTLAEKFPPSSAELL